MSFELEEYVPESMGDGDRLKPSDVVDHPLIVKVLDYRESLTTRFSPLGDGEAVVLDILDLSDSKIHLGVMWFNSAIRDNLKNKVGKVLPIRLIYQAPKKAGGNPYLVPSGLEGVDLETARAWAKAKPTVFDDERIEREMGEYKSSAPAPQAQGAAFSAAAPAASAPAASAPPAASPPPAATPPPAANAPVSAIKPPAASAPPAAAAPPVEADDEIPF